MQGMIIKLWCNINFYPQPRCWKEEKGIDFCIDLDQIVSNDDLFLIWSVIDSQVFKVVLPLNLIGQLQIDNSTIGLLIFVPLFVCT